MTFNNRQDAGFDYSKPITSRPCGCQSCALDGQHAPMCAVHCDPPEQCDCDTTTIH